MVFNGTTRDLEASLRRSKPLLSAKERVNIARALEYLDRFGQHDFPMLKRHSPLEIRVSENRLHPAADRNAPPVDPAGVHKLMQQAYAHWIENPELRESYPHAERGMVFLQRLYDEYELIYVHK